MSFDSKTGQIAGQVGGKKSAVKRWGGKDPSTVRKRSLRLTVSNDELDMMDTIAAAECISRTELIVRAVREYRSAGRWDRKNNP
jgi:hypothetical protein